MPMADEAVRAVVVAIVENGIDLPGVSGEAATAACFAGHWSERRRSAVRPWQGQRIYEVEEVTPEMSASGEHRRATSDERGTAIAWFQKFQSRWATVPAT